MTTWLVPHSFNVTLFRFYKWLFALLLTRKLPYISPFTFYIFKRKKKKEKARDFDSPTPFCTIKLIFPPSSSSMAQVKVLCLYALFLTLTALFITGNYSENKDLTMKKRQKTL